MQVTNELKSSLKNDVVSQLKSELRDKVTNELKTELHDKVINEQKTSLKNDVTSQRNLKMRKESNFVKFKNNQLHNPSSANEQSGKKDAFKHLLAHKLNTVS